MSTGGTKRPAKQIRACAYLRVSTASKTKHGPISAFNFATIWNAGAVSRAGWAQQEQTAPRPRHDVGGGGRHTPRLLELLTRPIIREGPIEIRCTHEWFKRRRSRPGSRAYLYHKRWETPPVHHKRAWRSKMHRRNGMAPAWCIERPWWLRFTGNLPFPICSSRIC